MEAHKECLPLDGASGTWREAARDAAEGGQPRLGGADSRLRWRVCEEGGTPQRRRRLPGRGGAGPGQEEVSAPGHPPRGGFPESSRRERAPALGLGGGGRGGGELGKEGGRAS